MGINVKVTTANGETFIMKDCRKQGVFIIGTVGNEPDYIINECDESIVDLVQI